MFPHRGGKYKLLKHKDMENFSGLFMLVIIGWAAWATEKYFKTRKQQQNKEVPNEH